MQGWEFTLSLKIVSESLSSFSPKEQPWVSESSSQKSDRVNHSRRSFKKSDVSNSLVRSQKWAICSKQIVVFTMVLTVFHSFSLFMPKSELLPSLFDLYKRATVSNLFPSLFHSQKISVSLEKPKSKFPTLYKPHPSQISYRWLAVEVEYRKGREKV